MTSRPTALVTGGSAGIGAAAARALHAAGLRVFVTGRDPRRTAEVAEQLGTDPIVVDFADLADVRRAATTILERCPRLDVLANNAGGNWSSFQRTVDGHEMTWQVNHLAPALLTELLLPRLLDGATAERPARVIATSSGLAARARLDLHAGAAGFDDPARFRSAAAYGTSKLANIVTTRDLQRRAARPGLLAMSFQPGMVVTDLSRDNAMMTRLLRSPLRWLMRTPEQGAETLVWLATAPAGDLEPGGHYASRRVRPAGARAGDPVTAARLRDLTMQAVFPAGVPSVDPLSTPDPPR